MGLVVFRGVCGNLAPSLLTKRHCATTLFLFHHFKALITASTIKHFMPTVSFIPSEIISYERTYINE